MTKERPILFSGAMVRAILDGRKSQTRRIVKPQPTSGLDGWDWSWPIPGKNVTPGTFDRWRDDAKNPLSPHYCPYGKPGDRLWVRETWSADFANHHPHDRVWYAADDDRRHDIEVRDGVRGIFSPESNVHVPFRWRPSIHMPRWACRLELEITGVRVERLNGCSEADAIAEGIAPELDGWTDYTNPSCQMCLDPVDSYRTLWNSINGAGAWDANPWVWVVEFRMLSAMEQERDKQ